MKKLNETWFGEDNIWFCVLVASFWSVNRNWSMNFQWALEL